MIKYSSMEKNKERFAKSKEQGTKKIELRI